MSTFNDKNTGKALDTRAANIESFKAILTGSGTTKQGGRTGADIDGKRHEFVDFGKIPFRYKQGDQAKFFPGIDSDSKGGINTGSEDIIRNTVDGIVYFSISPSKFVENLVGASSDISKSLAFKHGASGLASKGSAYTQISQSVVNLFSASIAAEGTVRAHNITFAAQENYTAGATSASAVNNTPFPTASLVFRSPEGSASYSGIADGLDGSIHSQGYQMTLDLSDSVACHEFMIRFGGGVEGQRNLFLQQFFPSFSIDFRNSLTTGSGGGGTISTGSFAMGVGSGNNVSPTSLSYLTGAAAFSFLFTGEENAIAQPVFTQSEAVFGSSNPIPIRGVGQNTDEGTYRTVVMKGLGLGDGQTSGSSASDFDFFEFKSAINSNHTVNTNAVIVVYPSSSVVSSGSFKFVPITSGGIVQNPNSATASAEVRTVFFLSGAASTPGFQGIFTGSAVGSGGSPSPQHPGSLIHKDPKLRIPADPGYYSPTGSDVAGNHVFEFNTSSVSLIEAGDVLNSGSVYIPRVVRKLS